MKQAQEFPPHVDLRMLFHARNGGEAGAEVLEYPDMERAYSHYQAACAGGQEQLAAEEPGSPAHDALQKNIRATNLLGLQYGSIKLRTRMNVTV